MQCLGDVRLLADKFHRDILVASNGMQTPTKRFDAGGLCRFLQGRLKLQKTTAGLVKRVRKKGTKSSSLADDEK